MIRNVFKGTFVSIAAALVLAGCAQLGTQGPQTDEEAVTTRSQVRLDLLRAGDFEAAYAYMSPGYRARKTLNQFKLEHSGVSTWIKGEVASAECVEDRCTVFADIAYRTRAGAGRRPSEMGAQQPAISRTFEERWVRIDDTWWFYDSN